MGISRRKISFINFFDLLRSISCSNFYIRIIIYIIFSLLATLGELFSTYLISNYVAYIVGSSIQINLFLRDIFLQPINLILFVLATGLFRFLSLYLLPKLATYIGSKVASKAFSNYINSSIEDKDGYDFNEIQTTFSIRSSQLTGGVIYTFLNIINYSLILIIFIYYLLSTQPKLTFSLIFLVLALYFISVLISRDKIKFHSKIMDLYNNNLIALIDSSLRDKRYLFFNFDSFKLSEEYRNIDHKLRNSSTQLTFISSLPKVFIECLFYIGILLFVITLRNIGEGNISNIPNLIILLACFQRLLPSIQGIYSNGLTLKAYLPVVNYFNKFLKREIDDLDHYKSNDQSIINIEKDLVLKSSEISYAYKGKDSILKYPALNLSTGDFILVKGISGKGKSTWIDLLFGIRKPISGCIKRNYNHKSLIYLNASVSKEDVIRMLNSYFYKLSKLSNNKNEPIQLEKLQYICGIDFFDISKIDSLNLIKDIEFSTGQYQRLQIFLALILEPSLLILDESLNAIEIELEHEILRNIKKNFLNLTLIQITHRPYEKETYTNIYNL